MGNNKIASIIVAAGFSSRMGSFKPFLNFGGIKAVEMVVDTHKSAGISDIIVVTGFNGNEVEEVLKASEVRCVFNESYENGMFTSVVKGVEALDKNVDAFFMHPVDIPLVKRHTLEILKNNRSKSCKGIIYPEFCGKKGHPPLIDRKYKQSILESNGEGGLKRILDRYPEDSLHAAVFDRAVTMDMDTREDYEELLRYYNAAAPDIEECNSILSIYKVPDNIIRHCREVARVSLVMLNSLKTAGCPLDEDALEAAALLHDIAKREKNHAQAGGELLKELGYGKVGEIIASHTDIEVNENAIITENEILYLADKLVNEDKVISVEERFRHSLEIYGNNPQALEKIKRRWNTAEKIARKIEKATGRGLVI